MKTGIVTDSTCDLGPDYLASRDVVMVPLKVMFGEESHRDWVDFTPDEFYARLVAFEGLPTTSQPAPADFEVVYDRLAQEGCDEIVSIHLSAPLSGTCESALIAARTSQVPVRVVDTKSASQGEGLVVKAAADARDAGADADTIERVAIETAAKVRLLFVFESMEYLVKGGRAGKAAGLAASLLNIKAVLEINADGIIEPYAKSKGMRKAIEAMAAKLAQDATEGPVRVAIMHSERPDLVAQLQDAIHAQGLVLPDIHVGLIGAVIGTYTGPGAIGVAYHRVD